MWRGWTRPEDADAYAEGLRERIKDQATMPGKIGSILLCRRKGDRSEFVTISFFESLEAVRVLAGEHLDQSAFFPLDDQYLVDRETTVSHFEVVGSEGIWPSVRTPTR
jgi:antibiotic biosynthesis monooxygenase (ABM) superfamily enzyme